MGLFDIVQYEVQALEDGHWTVRARHTRSERDHAFTEARRIDLNENHPARVVRDVYDPQSGRSQEFTVFMSDRARSLKPGAPAASKPKAAARKPAKDEVRRSVRPAPLAFRVTMAAGVGVVTALLVTAIATWALGPSRESFASVLARSPAPGPAMTLFAAVVLFSLFTLLRGPLGISRLARALSVRLGGAPAGGTLARRREPAPSPAPARREFAPRPAADPTDHPADHGAPVLSLAGVILARFFSEAAPADAAKAMEDSLALRGLALYLAGAASELASHLEMPSPGSLLTQITPPLLRDAAEEALADLRALTAADSALAAAGRAGLRKYVSAADERPCMSGALAAWHKGARAETPHAKAS